MKRLRCCGRWCYWRLPVGPWACTVCPRLYDGPMPASAGPRFDAYAADLAAKVPPWTEEQRAFVRACFGRLVAL